MLPVNTSLSHTTCLTPAQVTLLIHNPCGNYWHLYQFSAFQDACKQTKLLIIEGIILYPFETKSWGLIGLLAFYSLLLYAHTSSRGGVGVTMTPVLVMLIHVGTFRQGDRTHPRAEKFNFTKYVLLCSVCVPTSLLRLHRCKYIYMLLLVHTHASFCRWIHTCLSCTQEWALALWPGWFQFCRLC